MVNKIGEETSTCNGVKGNETELDGFPEEKKRKRMDRDGLRSEETEETKELGETGEIEES